MERADLGRGPRQPIPARIALRDSPCGNNDDRCKSRCQRHREHCGNHKSPRAPKAPLGLDRGALGVRQCQRQSKPDCHDCQKKLSGQKCESDGDSGLGKSVEASARPHFGAQHAARVNEAQSAPWQVGTRHQTKPGREFTGASSRERPGNSRDQRGEKGSGTQGASQHHDPDPSDDQVEQEPPACQMGRRRNEEDCIERIGELVQRVCQRGQPQSLQWVPQHGVASHQGLTKKPAPWVDLTADIALKQDLPGEKREIEDGQHS